MARVSWPSSASLNPQACRSMWECTRNVNFAATPALATMSLISGYGQRRAALRDEDVWGRCGFAQELAQRAAFPRRYRMHAGISALRPAHMQAPGGEVDVVPTERHQLRGPQTMAVSDQDRRGVAMPRAVLLADLDEPLDLPVGE